MPGSVHGCNGPRFVSRFAEVFVLSQPPPQTAKKRNAPAIVQSLGTAPRYPPRPGQTITKQVTCDVSRAQSSVTSLVTALSAFRVDRRDLTRFTVPDALHLPSAPTPSVCLPTAYGYPSPGSRIPNSDVA